MAPLANEQDMRTQLKAALTTLASFNAGELARKGISTELSFESGAIFFSRTLRLFHALNEANLDDIPHQKMSQIYSAANEAVGQFNNVNNFSLQKYPNNPIAQRDSFIAQIRDSYDSVYENVAPTIAFLTQRGTDFEKLEEQAKETVGRINKIADDNKTAMDKAIKDSNAIVAEVRKVAQEAGVSQHAIHFKDEATEHENAARPWLITTATLAIGTLALAVSLTAKYIFYPDYALTTSLGLQIAISKIVTFS